MDEEVKVNQELLEFGEYIKNDFIESEVFKQDGLCVTFLTFL